MIRQSLANSDGILEKKFKILRTSIMLGNLRNREETLLEYEETAREIDKLKKNVYEELLASKMYTTTSLEEEYERLDNLIKFVEGRIKERNDFVDDYIKITANFLDDLPRVSLENELSSYKARLNNIDEYLNNCNRINELNDKIKNLRDDLQEKYENKANNEIINAKLEEELIDEFNKVIAKDEYYSNLNYTDIEDELIKIETGLSEKRDVMDTFTSSYDALTSAGISGAEREEYLSYVQDARRDYYKDLERKYILNIYKLVLDKESDYDRLYIKRTNINNLLIDRDKERKDLEISDRDSIEYFANLCKEQFSVIKAQKFNMENIDKLILEITDCESELEKLEVANSREEILNLLREYSISKPEIEKIELPKENDIYDEVIKKNIDNNPKPANMVVRVEEPIKMNVKTASDTAKLVMKKVVIVLEPKKFNGKKDKLKEAEKELEERKRQERILAQEKKIEEEMREAEIEKQKKLEEQAKLEQELEEIKNDFMTEEKTLAEEDSIFEDTDLDEDNDSLDDTVGVKLETQDIFEDDVIDRIELDEVKINLPDSNEIVIPTEIFIEEPPKEETIDLFKETDPFLDDNHFEIEENANNSNEIISNMPTIKNIGTVKPNSMLSKIEDVAKENDDIILPTMGLTQNEKVDVPIVSENYIN